MDKKEHHVYNKGFYLSRINKYHEGNRPSKDETEDLLERLIKKKDQLEQAQKKELAIQSTQQALEELQKQIETKPE